MTPYGCPNGTATRPYMKTIISINLDAALAKHAGRGKSRSLKEIANALGVTDDTLRNYRTGETMIPAEKLLALSDMLGQTFLAEVLGVRRERLLWFDDLGGVREVADLQASAREFQGLPQNVRGDHEAALRRNDGWVSMKLNGGLALLRYHGHGLAAAAAARVAGYLTSEAAVVAASRTIDIEEIDGSSRTVEVSRELPEDAAMAIELAASITHLPPSPPWVVNRISLETVQHPQAQQLLRIAATTPAENIIQAACREKLLPWCSMMRVDSGIIYASRIGEQIRLSPEVKVALLGPLRRGPDLPYREMLERCVLGTLDEGEATYREIRGVLFGRESHYLQTAFAVPPAAGQPPDTYLSHTHPLN